MKGESSSGGVGGREELGKGTGRKRRETKGGIKGKGRVQGREEKGRTSYSDLGPRAKSIFPYWYGSVSDPPNGVLGDSCSFRLRWPTQRRVRRLLLFEVGYGQETSSCPRVHEKQPESNAVATTGLWRGTHFLRRRACVVPTFSRRSARARCALLGGVPALTGDARTIS